MEKINQIEGILAILKEDAAKFFSKGNSVAGTRTRKSAMEIIKLCKQLRDEVTESKNKETV